MIYKVLPDLLGVSKYLAYGSIFIYYFFFNFSISNFYDVPIVVSAPQFEKPRNTVTKY